MLASKNMIDTLPSALLAERNVLSICLRDEKLYRRAIAEGIDIECFHFPANRLLFRTCAEIPRDENGEIDLAHLVHFLIECGEIDNAGGPSEVYATHSYALSPAGWTQWLAMLREMKARRIAILDAHKLAETTDSDEAIARAARTLEKLRKAVTGTKRAKSAQDASQDFIERFERDHEAGDLPGFPTGISELNAISGGMRPGQLWTIGGKPSRGKSVLMLQIAADFVLRGQTVAVFSLEMMAHEIIGRLVSFCGRIDHGSITQPRQASKADLQRIKNAVANIAGSKLWIDDVSNQSIESIITEAERIRDMSGDIGLIVVDYLQLIRGHRNRGESREEEVARASGGLKQLAKAMQCPVLTGSQLNEQGQTRESRAIEQDSDCVLFIVDDGIKIGKMRNAQRDQVLSLTLDGAMQRFK
jgi:replicative DNA helicase